MTNLITEARELCEKAVGMRHMLKNRRNTQTWKTCNKLEEIKEKATCREFRQVRTEDKRSIGRTKQWILRD